jgi:hypothetical protein
MLLDRPVSRFQGDSSPNKTYALPGPDYFDEEAKCYSRLFEFCEVTFCHSRQRGSHDFGKII